MLWITNPSLVIVPLTLVLGQSLCGCFAELDESSERQAESTPSSPEPADVAPQRETKPDAEIEGQPLESLGPEHFAPRRLANLRESLSPVPDCAMPRAGDSLTVEARATQLQLRLQPDAFPSELQGLNRCELKQLLEAAAEEALLAEVGVTLRHVNWDADKRSCLDIEVSGLRQRLGCNAGPDAFDPEVPLVFYVLPEAKCNVATLIFETEGHRSPRRSVDSLTEQLLIGFEPGEALGRVTVHYEDLSWRASWRQNHDGEVCRGQVPETFRSAEGLEALPGDYNDLRFVVEVPNSVRFAVAGTQVSTCGSETVAVPLCGGIGVEPPSDEPVEPPTEPSCERGSWSELHDRCVVTPSCELDDTFLPGPGVCERTEPVRTCPARVAELGGRVEGDACVLQLSEEERAGVCANAWDVQPPSAPAACRHVFHGSNFESIQPLLDTPGQCGNFRRHPWPAGADAQGWLFPEGTLVEGDCRFRLPWQQTAYTAWGYGGSRVTVFWYTGLSGYRRRAAISRYYRLGCPAGTQAVADGTLCVVD